MSIPSHDVAPQSSTPVKLGVTTERLDTDAEQAFDSAELDPGRAPVRLGHYVLLDKLGHGGMGVVYSAYDERLDRKVAIKLLRTQGGARSELRLIREAQALARISHPNVVHIYEIGELETRAFLVMELIQGVTLRHWRTETKRGRAELLAVFLAAGRGLAAAHAEGLVHRDFKPENVMIRRDGRVVVMDFGLARGHERGRSATGESAESHAPDSRESPPSHGSDATDEARSSELERALTVAGTIMGTPGYMAPEQLFGGSVSDRSDQFSFCVTLWEALYHKRPFRGAHLESYGRSLVRGELQPNDSAEVPAWLRTVLERGLARDPDRRWGSMDELLEALQRDPTRRRRRITAAASLLGSAALLAGVVHVADKREQQRAAHDRAELVDQCEREGRAIADDWNPEVSRRIAATFETTQTNLAATTWQHTQPWLDRYANEWSSLRSQICIEAEVENSRDPSTHSAINDCLDEGRAAFVGLLEALATGDLDMLGSATTTATRLPPPSSCTSEALLRHRKPVPDELRPTIIALRVRIERARALLRADKHPQVIVEAELLRSEAETIAWRPLITDAELIIASAQAGLGKYEEAERAAVRALRVAIVEGNDLGIIAASSLLTRIVGDHLARGDEGLAWGRLGEQLIARLGLAGSYHEAALLDQISVVLSRTGALSEALAYAERNLALTEALFGTEHPNVGRALVNLSGKQSVMGRYADALETSRRGLALLEAAHGPEHSDIAAAHYTIGKLLQGSDDYDAALPELERALEIWEAVARDQPKVATGLNSVGVIHRLRGDPDRALELHRRALAMFEAALPSPNPSIAATLLFIADALTDKGAYDEALEHYRRSQQMFSTTLGASHTDVYLVSSKIADMLLAKGDAKEALIEYRSALVGYALTLEPDHPRFSETRLGIGLALLELGDPTGAAESLEQVIAARERHEDLTPSRTELAARFALARALTSSEPTRARTLAKAAAAGYRGFGDVDDAAAIEAWLIDQSLATDPADR